MRSRLNLIIVIALAAIVVAVLYVTYRLIDPLPPRRLAIAAGAAGSGYDNFARQYARILARHGVELEIRNFAGAIENLDQLRDAASGVQAALTTFGVTQSADADTFYSLGGVFDAAIFIFYRNSEPVTLFSQFRGKRLSIGMTGTALRLSMMESLIGMRHVPTLDFIHDALPETARHIDDLLEKVRESDAQAARSSSGAMYAGESDPYKKPRAPATSTTSTKSDPSADRHRRAVWSSSTRRAA